jgi:hypothetical protein
LVGKTDKVYAYFQKYRSLMSQEIIIVCVLTFVIHLVGTYSLAIRIVGLRTGKWSMSYALFNILALVTRLSTTFQAPLLAKTIELNILNKHPPDTGDFRLILGASTLAMLVGGLTIPTFQRLLATAVERYYVHKSFFRLTISILNWGRFVRLGRHVVLPKKGNWGAFKEPIVPTKVIVLNLLSQAVLTVGVLATLYAGYLNPDLRSTSASMSGFINGFAAIVLVVVVDPNIALLSDEVANNNVSPTFFRKYIIVLTAVRILGTVLSQVLLLPLAHLVVLMSETLAAW